MQEPERSLEHVVTDDVHVLRLLTPRLDEEAALLVLEDELGGIIRQYQTVPPKIALNFEAVEYIFTAGLAKLVSCRRMILDRGGKIGLCCLHEDVKEVLGLMGFEELFLICETEGEVLAQLQEAQ